MLQRHGQRSKRLQRVRACRPPGWQQTGGVHGTQHQLPRLLPACPTALHCNAMADRAVCRPRTLPWPGPGPWQPHLQSSRG